MSRGDDLPPSARTRLSAFGWAALVASLVLGAALAVLHPSLGALYAVFVAFGFVAGIPGGMQYQAEVDLFLSNNPEFNRSDLPWPEDYTELNRNQAWSYTKRGLFAAIIYGLLIPVVLVLGALVRVGLLNGKILEALYSAN